MRFERLEKLMFEAAEVPNWLLIIYEGSLRFTPRAVDQMIADFVRACGAVGKTFQASSTGRSHTKI